MRGDNELPLNKYLYPKEECASFSFDKIDSLKIRFRNFPLTHHLTSDMELQEKNTIAVVNHLLERTFFLHIVKQPVL